MSLGKACMRKGRKSVLVVKDLECYKSAVRTLEIIAADLKVSQMELSSMLGSRERCVLSSVISQDTSNEPHKAPRIHNYPLDVDNQVMMGVASAARVPTEFFHNVCTDEDQSATGVEMNKESVKLSLRKDLRSRPVTDGMPGDSDEVLSIFGDSSIADMGDELSRSLAGILVED